MAGMKKKPDPALAYTVGKQQSDRQATKDYYANKIKSLAEKDNPNPVAYLMSDQKTKDKMDKVHQDLGRASAYYNSDVADQNRWIAMGARANALAQMKLKKKGK
jgi:hypothetical protein